MTDSFLVFGDPFAECGDLIGFLDLIDAPEGFLGFDKHLVGLIRCPRVRQDSTE